MSYTQETQDERWFVREVEAWRNDGERVQMDIFTDPDGTTYALQEVVDTLLDMHNASHAWRNKYVLYKFATRQPWMSVPVASPADIFPCFGLLPGGGKYVVTDEVQSSQRKRDAEFKPAKVEKVEADLPRHDPYSPDKEPSNDFMDVLADTAGALVQEGEIGASVLADVKQAKRKRKGGR